MAGNRRLRERHCSAQSNELLDSLQADYKKPEGLIGEDGLLKRLTKNRGSFPPDETFLKLFYLALHYISQKWTMPIPGLESRAKPVYYPVR